MAPTASTTGLTASTSGWSLTPSPGTAATCRETCVAPLANAVRVIASTMPGITSSATRQLDPKGPTSTAAPAAVAASIAAVTCGPGRPSTNGSIVNSSSCTARIVARRTPGWGSGTVRAACHRLQATCLRVGRGGRARLLHSVPAESKASFMRPSAGSKDECQSLSRRSRAGPCQTVLASAERTVVMIWSMSTCFGPQVVAQLVQLVDVGSDEGHGSSSSVVPTRGRLPVMGVAAVRKGKSAVPTIAP